MAKNTPWKKAIEQVLKEAGTSMHYKDIASQIIADGLRTNIGATPAATVSANLTTSIKQEKEKSPFRKVGRGEYVLRTLKPEKANEEIEEETDEGEKEEKQYAIISSFGMFWRRDLVDWNFKASLLGMQQLGAEPVNFHEQLGIYLLYDGREIIYVGRSSERPLGRRLYEHTVDRLATRWDRFSWFGLLPVTDKGKFASLPDSFSSTDLIPSLEAILIEALEPRQNRKRGDDLAAVEFLQKEDPEIERKKKEAILKAALENV